MCNSHDKPTGLQKSRKTIEVLTYGVWDTRKSQI